MLPEGKLIKGELLIREMNLPDDVKLTKKSLVRWIALSLGLISPNESRTISLDVLECLINFQIRKLQPSTKDIIDELAKMNVQADEKSVYYHLLKMKEAGLIDRKNGKYFFGGGEDNQLSLIIRKIYQEKFERTFKNVEEAFNAVESYGH